MHCKPFLLQHPVRRRRQQAHVRRMHVVIPPAERAALPRDAETQQRGGGLFREQGREATEAGAGQSNDSSRKREHKRPGGNSDCYISNQGCQKA